MPEEDTVRQVNVELVSTAVLSVEHKAEVEQVSFLGSVGTVVAQGGKNALCKALVLVYLVHYH